MKKTVYVTSYIVFLFLFTVSFASAQVMDDLWFKLNIDLKGFDFGGDMIHAARYKMPAYVHLTWYGYEQYTFHTYTFTGSTWNVHETRNYVDGENYYNFVPYFSKATIFVYDGNGNSFTLDFVTRINLRENVSGSVMSASFTDAGCLCTSSSVLPDEEFAGSCKISARTIDPSKLPFTP